MASPVGLLPAAGQGSRYSFPASLKELHPIPVRTSDPARLRETRPVCEFALDALARAGAERCGIVVAPTKTAIARALGNESRHGLALTYIVQPSPLGVPNAVVAAASWVGERDVLLALPDTVHFPDDALHEVHVQRLRDRADVMLGVFPVSAPADLGPVDFLADGTVLRVYDKPHTCPVRNSWGLASWSARFTAFCVSWDAREARRSTEERFIGETFEAARQAGLRVHARFFPGGGFGDVGTPAGLTESMDLLRRRDWLAADGG